MRGIPDSFVGVVVAVVVADKDVGGVEGIGVVGVEGITVIILVGVALDTTIVGK